MTQPAPLKATALNATHRRMGAKMVDFGGWDMPAPILRHPRRAPRRPLGRRAVRRQPHGRNRNPRPGGGHAHRLRHHQRRCQTQARASAVFGPALRTRRVRRRHSGAQSRRRPLLPVRQRVQSGKGFRAHRASLNHASTPGLRRSHQRSLRAARHPGPPRAAQLCKS